MTLEELMEQLEKTISTIQLDYSIWRTFTDPEVLREYREFMNDFQLFFVTSIHAHLLAYTVGLYRLFEKRTDTVNIPQLLKMVQADTRFSKENLADLKKLYAEAKPLWIKIGIVRNEVFAHQSIKYNSDEAFKKANFTPNGVSKLIEISKKILHESSVAIDIEPHPFDMDVRQDTIRLLKALKEAGSDE